ncbi:MAG: valine--tRNA ligase [Bacteroidetes bacterium GWE2_41_25]|nr:MAG: valine--tRNA ligase [Bacteroidetes bacterium GWA2_40_15]OFX97426.1 MAG: valine--tRNA ligase [Bacteroidetes bacterium GWC2_40_22]OFX98346.1 MAG: valine--tRNA ligase [Bacteroidetes bacterium GWE2_41_25]HBH84927.1 valine--tRNA ligase [Bacteroidales bacterium]HBQ83260.1 valine--tRNA ligase [Bacteroidales bacterium]
MNIPSKYEPGKAESKWYSYWMEQGFFRSTPDDREPYTIVIPPPNVTGVLHMGHMLNNTIQDVLVRRARMQGKNACWVPGTDHASIATEAKVVAKLKEEGIEKRDLTREEFLGHAWEWTHKHGGIILEQLKRLGASCDWDRTLFTMDEKRYDSVIKVFVDLHNKGLIYRGVRMVNWDPQAMTAVSDEEVNYTDEKSKLYYVRYKIVGEDGYVTVATTRPETILGDTAVCANPEDERYTHLKGKKVIVPMVDREVPFIFDSYVDKEFGTGCLKITPAHDINDYEIGIRHKLPSIDVFNDDGTISQRAGMFAGVDRFVAKDLAEKELRARGNLVKVENYDNKIGRSERTNAVIEPRLSLQWFLKMKEISKPALEAVMDGEIHLHPAKFRNLYRHWMENVHDWCISRQLWWGHRIPAWYYDNSEFVVAENEKEALELARKKSGRSSLKPDDLRQDEDVLDTWFSSWLWPITSFDGINHPENPDYNYYYPTNDLITAPEILFFWVARMIIAGYEYKGEKPFSNVYLTGLVRDQQRRKMSKSLGNSPEPIELIEKYGADGVRVGMLLCSPAGNDLLYEDSLPEQGRNFANKIWNAFRLVQHWNIDDTIEQPGSSKVAVKWMNEVLKKDIHDIDLNFRKFRISEALMISYKLFWDEFSGWYLEIIKPEYQKAIDRRTYTDTIVIFESLLKVIHPFMPFITEELWQNLSERMPGESIMISVMPEAKRFNRELISDFEKIKETVTALRAVRKTRDIPNRESMELMILSDADSYDISLFPVLTRLCNLTDISFVTEKQKEAASFMIGTTEYFIPLQGKIDTAAEIVKLKDDLTYNRGFLLNVMKKLDNERFVANAPANVLELERRKKSDTESRIKSIEERIKELKKMS